MEVRLLKSLHDTRFWLLKSVFIRLRYRMLYGKSVSCNFEINKQKNALDWLRSLRYLLLPN